MFTEKDVADRVREIAQAEPDTVYVYQSGQSACSYVPGPYGDQRCLIGRALADLGVPDSFFEHRNQSGYSTIVHYLESGGYLSLETGGPWRDWLVGVQDYQDGGAAWGRSVQAMDDALSAGEL